MNIEFLALRIMDLSHFGFIPNSAKAIMVCTFAKTFFFQLGTVSISRCPNECRFFLGEIIAMDNFSKSSKKDNSFRAPQLLVTWNLVARSLSRWTRKTWWKLIPICIYGLATQLIFQFQKLLHSPPCNRLTVRPTLQIRRSHVTDFRCQTFAWVYFFKLFCWCFRNILEVIWKMLWLCKSNLIENDQMEIPKKCSHHSMICTILSSKTTNLIENRAIPHILSRVLLRLHETEKYLRLARTLNLTQLHLHLKLRWPEIALKRNLMEY